MTVSIAIPEPTSTDSAYNQRSLPQYIAALHSAGATPIVIPLHERKDRVAKVLAGVQGILLPGSGFDVDPQRYGEDRIPACAEADPGRAAMDGLLLESAFSVQKPVLGICAGAQELNVWRNGSLVQDLQTAVNHTPGRGIVDAHAATIMRGSRLSKLLDPGEGEASVNSSHHQAIKTPGDDLLVVAVSPTDGVVEAVELDSADHFVVGVQWHPERTYTQKPLSRAIFAAFVEAAESWQLRRTTETALKA
jgi:putative glutamine amidotransferase